MREMVAINGNVLLYQDGDDNWEPNAELIIVTSEVEYHLDEDLELKRRRRTCEAFRILVTEKSISEFIAGLEKLRFEMQNQATAAVNANKERAA